jgi:hypothetical protein
MRDDGASQGHVAAEAMEGALVNGCTFFHVEQQQTQLT